MKLQPPPDQSERDRALDISQSALAIAPAGSGKTTLLVARFLKCLAVSNEPEEVVAITFTNKAAAEIRSRLVEALRLARTGGIIPPHRQLQHHLAQQVLARDAELGWRLLDNPNRLRATTIDALNAELAARLPLLSGLGGRVAITDDSRGLFEEAIKALFTELEDPSLPVEDRAALETLLRWGENRVDLLLDPLVDILGKREQWLELIVDLVREGSTQDADILHMLAKARIKALDKRLDRDRKVDLLSILHEGSAQSEKLAWAANLTAWPAPEAELLGSWQHLADVLITGSGNLRKAVDVRSGFLPKQRYTARMKALLKSFEGEPQAAAMAKACADICAHPGLGYPEHLHDARLALARALRRLALHLRVTFGRMGEMDFTEVALAALTALSGEYGYSEVLDHADTRIRHLLVDEMQDTSESQVKLLELLTSGWVPGDGHSLFMVGDPQQSIYAFRKAEVRLFLERWEAKMLGDVPLERITLSTNFRSSDSLIAWFNDCFTRIFPSTSDAHTGAVEYKRCEPPLRDTPAGNEPAVRIHAFLGKAEQAEAEAVAAQACALWETDRGNASIAVIGRTRPQLWHTIRALRRLDVPMACQDIDPLHDIPAVREYVQLARALWHPQDRLAWAVLLRSPLVGLSYADLVALSRGQPKLTWPEKIRLALAADGGLSTDGNARLHHLTEVLKQAEMDPVLYGDLPARSEAVWHALGGPATVSLDELQDVRAAMRCLREAASSGEIESLAQLRRSLASIYSSPTGGAVQVLTAHKAKGLEFDHVLLVGCGRSARGDDKPLLHYRAFDKGLLLVPRPPANLPADDPAHAFYDFVHQLHREAGRSELLRLLYVCCTRARRSLTLFANATLNSKGEPMARSGSFAELLWPVIKAEFDVLLQNHAPLAPEPSLVLPRMPRLPAKFRFTIDDIAYRPQERRSLRPSEAALDAQEAKPREGDLYARLVGVMYHEAMRRIARDGLDRWSDAGISRHAAMAAGFRHLGLPEPQLQTAVARVLRLLQNTLTSEHGRWLLAPRAWSQTEYVLAGYREGQWVSAIIDRCFEEDGQIWVIDYKTTVASAETALQQHAAQVRMYADLLGVIRQRPVRGALFLAESAELVKVD